MIRAGTWLPSRRRSADATTRFGDPRFFFVYSFKQRETGARCFAIGALRIRRAHLEQLPDDTRVDVTVIGALRIDRDVEPSLADAKLGAVHAFPVVRADARIKRVLRAHSPGTS